MSIHWNISIELRLKFLPCMWSWCLGTLWYSDLQNWRWKNHTDKSICAHQWVNTFTDGKTVKQIWLELAWLFKVHYALVLKPPIYLRYITCQSENNFTMMETNLCWILSFQINFIRCQTKKERKHCTLYIERHCYQKCSHLFTFCQKPSLKVKFMSE